MCGSRFSTLEVPIEDINPNNLTISLSGLPVDQAKAVRTLVDALSYVEEPSHDARRAMEDA